MDFSDSIVNAIKLVDQALASLGASSLLESKYFEVDWASAGHYRLIVNANFADRNTIPLTFYFEGDSIRLDVCGIDESFVWSEERIAKAPNEIVGFVRQLFTSFILLEKCGSMTSKSRLYLFDKNGLLIGKFALRGFIHKFSGWECDKVLYQPMY